MRTWVLLRVKEEQISYKLNGFELSLHHRCKKGHQGPSLGGPGAERLRLLDLNQAGTVSQTNALIAREILDPTLK